jgi:NADPH2:quinone reductase
MQFPHENMKNTMELVQWHAQGKLKPHIHAQYPLDKSQQAMQEMMDRKVRGKIVINC